MSLLFRSLHLTTTLRTHPPLRPLLPGPLCNMWLMWLFVLCVLTAPSAFHFAVAAERTARKLQCLLSLLLAVTHWVSARRRRPLSSRLYSWLAAAAAAVPLQLCSCCHDVQVSGDRAVYRKHITNGIIPG